MAFILPNWQNKNNRLYTQVTAKCKKDRATMKVNINIVNLRL